MNRAQFERSVKNRRVYDPHPLLSESAAAKVVRGAAARQRKLEAAREAWAEIAGGPARCAAEISAVEPDRVIVEAGDPTTAYELQRRRKALEAALSRRLPGFTRLHIIVRGAKRPPT
ncbi:hypothetical protein RAS1_22090 [Phycisphaerae bacterium RAS1]|nr:hypothetical protein RAS1_22090 [Phycisphaerae bacterium RAS1]